jgi:hypothetical protein
MEHTGTEQHQARERVGQGDAGAEGDQLEQRAARETAATFPVWSSPQQPALRA